MIKRHLSESEQAKLLRYFDDNRHDATCVLIELIFYTGIRTNELMHLTLSMLDEANGMLHVTLPSKGSEQRSVYVPKHLLRSLVIHCEEVSVTELAKLLGSEAKDVDGVKKMLWRRWADIRLEVFGFGFRLGLHALRHSFAARVFKVTGNNIVAAKTALGHKELSSTMRYMKHIDMNQVNDKLRVFATSGTKRLKKLTRT